MAKQNKTNKCTNAVCFAKIFLEDDCVWWRKIIHNRIGDIKIAINFSQWNDHLWNCDFFFITPESIRFDLMTKTPHRLKLKNTKWKGNEKMSNSFSSFSCASNLKFLLLKNSNINTEWCHHPFQMFNVQRQLLIICRKRKILYYFCGSLCGAKFSWKNIRKVFRRVFETWIIYLVWHLNVITWFKISRRICNYFV